MSEIVLAVLVVYGVLLGAALVHVVSEIVDTARKRRRFDELLSRPLQWRWPSPYTQNLRNDALPWEWRRGRR